MKLTEEQFQEMYERTQRAIKRAAERRAVSPTPATAIAPAVPFPPVGKPDDTTSPVPAPEPQPRPRRKPARKAKDEAGSSDFFVVDIESARVRLLDSDNIFVKWVVDAISRGGWAPPDSPDRVQVKVSQRKVSTPQEEETLIRIYRISRPVKTVAGQ